MDDSYLIHEDIEHLGKCLEKLREVYAEYGITINEKKTKICDLRHGFTYLKTRFYITESGHIIKKPCREAITRERRKLKEQAKLLEAGVLTFVNIRTSYASWRGSMSHRDAYRTVKNMGVLFDRLFIENWRSIGANGFEDYQAKRHEEIERKSLENSPWRDYIIKNEKEG